MPEPYRVPTQEIREFLREGEPTTEAYVNAKRLYVQAVVDAVGKTDRPTPGTLALAAADLYWACQCQGNPAPMIERAAEHAKQLVYTYRQLYSQR